MTCDYTYNTPDGRDHLLDVTYIHHKAYPQTMEDPGEPEYCEIEEIICTTCEASCEEEERIVKEGGKEWDRIAAHCLEHYQRTV